MNGVHDFCGHYDWTFEWLRARGGETLVREYWECAIYRDSQRHAGELIRGQGFDGMAAYWQHTLTEEAAGFHTTRTPDAFRIDMHDCPSKGFLLHNGLEQYHDYCDHCLGWIGPLMRDAGFVVDHEHNHRGQCWWEFRRAAAPAAAAGTKAEMGDFDVRRLLDWRKSDGHIDRFVRATDTATKTKAKA